MTALLASVRSYDEALDAVEAGAELIDLKEPDAGALGGLAISDIARIVQTLRARYPVKPISATIGNIPAHALDEMAARVIDVADAGVDYVKVGVTPGPDALRCLDMLAGLPAAVVPVWFCDREMNPELIAHSLELGFVGVMFDTEGKDGRTLFDHVDVDTLAQWLRLARDHGNMCGVAGSLGWPQLEQIRALAPDVVGFRTALCVDGRRSRLDPQRVAQWAGALHRSSSGYMPASPTPEPNQPRAARH
jgi:(5-formylfuran-3-yl)methyl phosphate synthase